MSKTFVGAVLLILVLSALSFLAGKNSAKSGDPAEIAGDTVSATTTATGTPPAAKPQSPKPVAQPVSATPKSTVAEDIRAVLTRAGNVECAYESVHGDTRSTNVLYVGLGKARGEFRMLTATSSKNTIMVYDGIALYTWTEGMATGKKTSVRSVSDISLLVPGDTSGGVILGKSMEHVSWACHPWVVNKTLLSPPSYVSFQ